MRAYIGMEIKYGYVVLQLWFLSGLHISAILGLPFKKAILSNAFASIIAFIMVLISPYDM